MAPFSCAGSARRRRFSRRAAILPETVDLRCVAWLPSQMVPSTGDTLWPSRTSGCVGRQGVLNGFWAYDCLNRSSGRRPADSTGKARVVEVVEQSGQAARVTRAVDEVLFTRRTAP